MNAAWFPADQPPPDDREVLVELIPARKNSKARHFEVGAYWRPNKAEIVAGLPPEWITTDGHSDLPVLRWQYITPLVTK